MKGLLRRQWYLSRKSFLMLSAIVCGLLFMEILVRLSLQYGNLANIENKDDLDEVTYCIFIMLNTFCCMKIFSSDYHVIQSDCEVGWRKFGYTLPVSEKLQAGATIVWVALGSVLGFAVSFLNYFILTFVSSRPVDKAFLWAIPAVGMLCILTECMRIPITYRFGKGSISDAIIIALIFILTSVISKTIVPYINSFSETHPEIIDKDAWFAEQVKSLLVQWGWVCPVLIVVAFVSSWLISARILEKRCR